MTRYVPVILIFWGLALCVWRPEWVSVAVLALLLCFALYLDNRERRAGDIEAVQEDVEAIRVRLAATTGLAEQIESIMEAQASDHIVMMGVAGEIKKVASEGMYCLNGLAAVEHDMKKLRADMEAIRVAFQGRPGRPPL